MLVEMNQLTVQSAKNLITIVIAFLIGAINTLILYPYFFGAEKQGLVVFLLSTSNLLMPLIGLGISQTIIKFYSSYPENQKQGFLSFVVIIPLIIIIPLSLLSIIFHDFIASLISLKNFFSQFNATIYKAEKINTHGGSIRIYVKKGKKMN